MRQGSNVLLAGLLFSLLSGCGGDPSEPIGKVQLPLDPPYESANSSFHTHGNKIHHPHGELATVDDLPGAEFRIQAVNWYGFETRNMVAHGLYEVDYKVIVDWIADHDFNAIRIPFSNEMWEQDENATVRAGMVSACPDCKGKSSRKILALIIDHAAKRNVHVILDNHRSAKGDSADESGMWYTSAYPEATWLSDWQDILAWVNLASSHVDQPTKQATDDTGWPVVMGMDLRNEPHTPGSGKNRTYLGGATWGTGDGVDPTTNPNPNPFAVPCVTDPNLDCHDWRLAAERAGSTLLGDAAGNPSWHAPLIFVNGIGTYPQEGTLPENNALENGWWGGNLMGARGNATNVGAPVLLNVGGDATGVGTPSFDKVVYEPHDYGPDLYGQPWFDGGTSYDSLSEVWEGFWAYLNGDWTPDVSALGGAFPFSNTGHDEYTSSRSLAAPVFVGEFGTTSADADVCSTSAGSQGQWFNSIVNFIEQRGLSWGYWAFNGNDAYSLTLKDDWITPASTIKLDPYLCNLEVGASCQPLPDRDNPDCPASSQPPDPCQSGDEVCGSGCGTSDTDCCADDLKCDAGCGQSDPQCCQDTSTCDPACPAYPDCGLDCDGDGTCNAACSADPDCAPACGGAGASCGNHGDCCSPLKCTGRPKTCG